METIYKKRRGRGPPTRPIYSRALARVARRPERRGGLCTAARAGSDDAARGAPTRVRAGRPGVHTNTLCLASVPADVSAYMHRTVVICLSCLARYFVGELEKHLDSAAPGPTHPVAGMAGQWEVATYVREEVGAASARAHNNT